MLAGPLDVVFVLHDVTTGRYHSAWFQEHPMPGSVPSFDEVTLVRLKSKMHHTTGAETLEEALAQMDRDLLSTLDIPASNVYRDGAVEWDGEIGIVCIVGNWRRKGAEKPFDPTQSVLNLSQATATSS